MANLNTHDIINMKSDYGKKLTAAVESAYDLKITSYTPIPEISLTSKKALISTSKGMLFLKEKPFYSKEPDSLFRSSSFQDYCSRNSDKFVNIIKTKDSSHYLEFQGSIYFLTPFVDAKSFTGENEELFKMLETITVLRSLGKNYLKENHDQERLLPKNKSYEIILPMVLFQPMINTSEEEKVFVDLKNALKVLTQEFDSFNNVEYVMAHSDCILFNFQILNEKAILHDFDNAKVLPSAHDIAEFFVSSCLLNYKGSITNLKLPIFLSCHKHTSNILANKILKILRKDEIPLFIVCVEIIWIWSLMLSVLKEDYKMSDLAPAIENIFERKLHKELTDVFSS